MTKTQKIPFDYDKFINSSEVINLFYRNGAPIISLCKVLYNQENEIEYPLQSESCDISSNLIAHTIEGFSRLDGKKDNYDILMEIGILVVEEYYTPICKNLDIDFGEEIYNSFKNELYYYVRKSADIMNYLEIEIIQQMVHTPIMEAL